MKELIFVYHAKSGLWNGVLDSIHKWTSPDTYPCHLCAITYGTVSMKGRWKKYIQSLPFPVIFYHLDDLPKELPTVEYPCAYLRNQNDAELFIHKRELVSCQDVEDLISLVNKKLKHPIE
ncbi:hypothetical protein [Alkalihalobacterium chitinilyticum]|uniref:GTPase n=1 Tax=Alkalihalobacterium chitinilyticum TaxID=2980103 RepID=A0ABT5VJH9_9BACI|nr:hypothetical protein [Alkalihalobacterium chitinilyticum]MDE5415609.1 hypothetical protein [Alkalihalobacterium chitinilyticum]